jgi:maleate cis-trans isomerase
MLDGVICVNGLPRANECTEEQIEDALKSNGIEGEIVRLTPSKAGRMALVKVGDQIGRLLQAYSEGVNLFEQRCLVTQGFEIVDACSSSLRSDVEAPK